MDNTVDKRIFEDLVKEKDALKEAVSAINQEMETYKELGTPEEIKTAMDTATNLVEKFEGVDVSNIEDLKKYQELGTPDQISEALEKSIEFINEYKNLGQASEIEEALERTFDLLSSYKELGTPDELGEALEVLEEKLVTSKCEQVAAKFNNDTDLVRRMYGKVEDFDIVEELLEETIGKKTVKKVDESKDGNTHSVVKESLNESLISKISKLC